MKEKFVEYKQALALKELGFDEPCLAYWSLDMVGDTIAVFRYNNRIAQAESRDNGQWFNHNNDAPHIWSAPLKQQVFQFFRDKYKLHGNVNIRTYFIYDISSYNDFKTIKVYDKLENTYEESEIACINKLIEIAKNNNNEKV